MAIGAISQKLETVVLMFFTTLISFVIIALAIFPHSFPARFIRRNSTIYLPSTNTTHPTNIITMVELFAGPVAWLWLFQASYPREPLPKGLDKRGG